MRRMSVVLGALVLVLAAAGAGHAVPLSDLLAGGTVTSGDMLFDNWSVSFFDASDGRAFDAADIDVTGLTGSVDPGLRFIVLNDALTMTGNDLYAYVDLMFGFKVTALDPALNIKDATLGMNGSLANTMNAGSDLGFAIRESIGTAPGLDDLAGFMASVDVNNDVPNSQPSGSAVFTPQGSIWVTKNILVWSVNSTDTAGLSRITQHFSQAPVVVPEPGMLALLALGGIALFRLKRG